MDGAIGLVFDGFGGGGGWRFGFREGDERREEGRRRVGGGGGK